ncbi:MAG: ribosome maturation factor RimP [Actinobacteria bacterium]|nr:ribosome maturation factor RimP [Actinomycetota bacterium]
MTIERAHERQVEKMDTQHDFGSAVANKVAALLTPIAEALGLSIYDIDYSGGTLRVVLDTPPGQPAGVSLDDLSLVTRQLGRELDHSDPVPGRYTLEVTSPGLERTLRRPEHYAREIGKTVNIRLHAPVNGSRRLLGQLVEATPSVITVRDADTLVDTEVALVDIERARTVFEWGAAEKPGKAPKKPAPKGATSKKKSVSEHPETNETSHTEASAS